MITYKEAKIMASTENGRKELKALKEQRQDEMNRILPGFYTLWFNTKIYSPRALRKVNY